MKLRLATRRTRGTAPAGEHVDEVAMSRADRMARGELLVTSTLPETGGGSKRSRRINAMINKKTIDLLDTVSVYRAPSIASTDAMDTEMDVLARYKNVPSDPKPVFPMPTPSEDVDDRDSDSEGDETMSFDAMVKELEEVLNTVDRKRKREKAERERRKEEERKVIRDMVREEVDRAMLIQMVRQDAAERARQGPR